MKPNRQSVLAEALQLPLQDRQAVIRQLQDSLAADDLPQGEELVRQLFEAKLRGEEYGHLLARLHQLLKLQDPATIRAYQEQINRACECHDFSLDEGFKAMR